MKERSEPYKEMGHFSLLQRKQLEPLTSNSGTAVLLAAILAKARARNASDSERFQL